MFCLRAQISLSVSPCVQKREGEKRGRKEKIHNGWPCRALAHRLHTEAQTSSGQLNKWPQTGVEAYLEGGVKNRERVRAAWKLAGGGRCAACEESLLFSLTFRGWWWLAKSESVRWRFPVSCRSTNHSLLPVLVESRSNLSSPPGPVFFFFFFFFYAAGSAGRQM